MRVLDLSDDKVGALQLSKSAGRSFCSYSLCSDVHYLTSSGAAGLNSCEMAEQEVADIDLGDLELR